MLKHAPSWAASLLEDLHTPCFIASERGIIEKSRPGKRSTALPGC